MSLPMELGTVLSLAGTALATTYATPGTTFYGGRPKKFRVTYTLVTITGTAITSLQAKLQACDGDPTVSTNWYDIESAEDSDAVQGAVYVEHSYTGITGPAKLVQSITCDGGFQAVRALAKATGGAGQAGESLVATCLALR
jgi:hypothetical protein